jgi:hypothetical protein
MKQLDVAQDRNRKGAHFLSKMFTLGLVAFTTLLSAGPSAQQTNKDIVDTAVAAGSFKTLAKALQAADLVDTLKGPGPYTVFAPTDEAFAKLPPGTLNDLLKAENKKKLQRILTYHVVPGRVSSSEVAKMRTAKTVSGDAIDITTNDGTVRVDNARHQNRRRGIERHHSRHRRRHSAGGLEVIAGFTVLRFAF